MIAVNRRIKEMLGSTTLAITARAKELAAQGHDVVNFGAGEPDFDTPDFIKKAGIEAINKGVTKYTPSIGTEDLRKAIAAKFERENGLVYKPAQIVVSCGAKHSLFNIIQVLVDDGDEVIFQAPFWVSYPEMVKAAGGKSVIINTEASTAFKITPELLLKHITPKTKILIINSPSNPTGVMYTKNELIKIAEICVKHKIYVISDEIYEKLVYDKDIEFVSIASLGREIFDLTITVNGVSKAYAMTGWRIGYAAGPMEIMEYIKKFQDHSTSNPTSISQAAAVAALNADTASIQAMVDVFKVRRDLMLACLDAIKVPYIRPQGAFYVFCDVSKIGDGASVAKRMLDEIKLAGIPGDSFGAPNFIRFSFATSEERIKEGISRFGKWIAQQ